MLMFIALFGLLTACVGIFISFDNRRVHKEKLARVQREIARREAAESKIENLDSPD